MENEMMKKNSGSEKDWLAVRPAADVVDEKDGVEISFDIPGASASDVHVEVKDHLLAIKAQSILHRRGMPIVYKRAFYLSDAVNVDKIEAKVSDGVLTLFLPKSDSARPHRIKVD